MKNANFLKENNAKHMWHPMAHPAEMRANPPKLFVSASGVELMDVDGHTVLDAVGGLWNVNLGYSCQPVKDAIRDQLDMLPYYSTFRGVSTAPAVELSYEIVEFFKADGMARAFFTSGGSDSVESALKLARQYWKLRGQHDRYKTISFKMGYHGVHFGGSSVTGNTRNRRNYEPLMPGALHLPAPHAYRNPFNEQDPQKLAELCANLLEDELKFQDPATVSAFIMEPVLGAGGVVVPHRTLMPRIREICDRYDVLLIADEVITAFGRTGAWTGSRLWGVQPDMMTIAKAITNGYYPFGAVMINQQLVAAFEDNRDATGNIGHGYTYSGHPVGAAAAIAALQETQRLKVHENAAARGEELIGGLRELAKTQPLIGDVRGQGLMQAVELVSDQGNKTPLDKDSVDKVFEAAYMAGVCLRVSGNVIIVSPSLVIDRQDVSRIVAAIDAGLGAVS